MILLFEEECDHTQHEEFSYMSMGNNHPVPDPISDDQQSVNTTANGEAALFQRAKQPRPMTGITPQVPGIVDHRRAGSAYRKSNKVNIDGGSD